MLTPITADSGLSCDPALSPDGTLLAYASDRSGEGNLDIWVQQVGGGDPIRVTRHEADDYEPSFSPDGTMIAFTSQRQGQQAGIYVVPTLSGEERQVVARGRRPRFSPNGEWIAYGDVNAVYIVSSAGGTPRRIAPEFLVAYSRDGTMIYFMSERDGFQCLWAQRLHPETKHPVGSPFEVQPLHHGQVRSMPLWQPGAAGTAIGGNTMVFSMTRASGNIWLISFAT